MAYLCTNYKEALPWDRFSEKTSSPLYELEKKKKKTQKAPLHWGERALCQGARLGQWGAGWTPTSTHLLYCAHWLGNLFRKDCCVLCLCLCGCVFTHTASLFWDNYWCMWWAKYEQCLLIFLVKVFDFSSAFLVPCVKNIAHAHTHTDHHHIYTDTAIRVYRSLILTVVPLSP